MLIRSQFYFPRETLAGSFHNSFPTKMRTAASAILHCPCFATLGGMTIHSLHRRQVIPQTIEAVFAFFAEAAKLEILTPPWLHFQIKSPARLMIQGGSQIKYRIRWRGVPLNWTTTITEWDPPHSFVDEQTRGPYRLWRHRHAFQSVEGGTLMTDIVEYCLPLGLFGSVIHACVVRGDLEAIFSYRSERVGEILGPSPSKCGP